MAETLSTNVCCLDLTQDCIDYLKSLELNVYEGTLGSVYTINWGRQNYGTKPVLIDIDIPANLHEYHVFIHDMENPHVREYNTSDHYTSHVESDSERHLECRYPVNTLDLRPFGTQRLSKRFQGNADEKRLEIIFVGKENSVEYYSNVVDGTDPRSIGECSNIEGWNLAYGNEKHGNRVVLDDNSVSKKLFEGRKNQVKYCRVFTLPTEMDGDERVIDQHFISLLSNESGECISYIYLYSDDYIKIVLPQVEDKAGLLKDLFENVLFPVCSDYFPDIEAKRWIHKDEYAVPAELAIQEKIEAKRKEFTVEIALLEDESERIREQYTFLKDLLTATGSELVQAVKKYLEWLGFESVEDKDETLTVGELKEEDLNLNYDGNLVLIEVKGITGTSTDAECSQVDKIVQRRIKKLRTTDVHGVYVVNHRKNVEPLKRPIPPFNTQQIDDAVAQDRTLVYTMQLFSLYSDIENGYITKDEARRCFMKPGLADFHYSFNSLGIPYSYFQNDTVVCVELKGTQISVGDVLFYKDELNRLVGCKVVGIQQDRQALETATAGKIGIKLEHKVPRNRELCLR